MLDNLVDLTNLSVTFLSTLAITQSLILLIRTCSNHVVVYSDVSNVESLLFEQQLVGEQCPLDLLNISTVAVMRLDSRRVSSSRQNRVHTSNLLSLEWLFLVTLIFERSWTVSYEFHLLGK